MISRIAVIAALLIVSACGQSTEVAPVPASAAWTDPSGRVSLTIPADWERKDPANEPGASAGSLLIVGPADQSLVARCDLYVVSQNVPAPATRALLNEAMDHFRDSPEMMAYRTGGGVTSADLVDVGGVRILDVRASRQTLSVFERRFSVASNGILEIYTLACSAFQSDQTARMAANGIANSLQIRD